MSGTQQVGNSSTVKAQRSAQNTSKTAFIVALVSFAVAVVLAIFGTVYFLGGNTSSSGSANGGNSTGQVSINLLNVSVSTAIWALAAVAFLWNALVAFRLGLTGSALGKDSPNLDRQAARAGRYVSAAVGGVLTLFIGAFLISLFVNFLPTSDPGWRAIFTAIMLTVIVLSVLPTLFIGVRIRSALNLHGKATKASDS